MAEIKAIQTHYNGHFFRSRLEARWAVFFDALGIRYEYEPQRFKIEGHGNYLPDFYLPDSETWVEVKGDWTKVSESYCDMLTACIDFGGCLPGVADSQGSTRGLLLLGPIPAEYDHNEGMVLHPILQHSKGVWMAPARFLVEMTWPERKAIPMYDVSFHVSGEYTNHGWTGCSKDLTTANGVTVQGKDSTNTKGAYWIARTARF